MTQAEAILPLFRRAQTGGSVADAGDSYSRNKLARLGAATSYSLLGLPRHKQRLQLTLSPPERGQMTTLSAAMRGRTMATS
jgi:hypothetical protein